MTLDEVRGWILESLLSLHESDPTVQRLRVCLAAMAVIERDIAHRACPTADRLHLYESARAALDAALRGDGQVSTGSGDLTP